MKMKTSLITVRLCMLLYNGQYIFTSGIPQYPCEVAGMVLLYYFSNVANKLTQI